MANPAGIAIVGLIFHTIAAVVWVGGMFFALLALRPATLALEPGPRLELWGRTLDRFFAWVIVAIVVLLVSGYGMVFGVFGGFRGIALYINLMQGIGIIMMMAFFHVYFAPWRRFKKALARGDHTAAARQLAQIRWIVALNLLLGLLTIAIGSSGPYWG